MMGVQYSLKNVMVQVVDEGKYGNGNHGIPKEIPQLYFYSVHF
jgi:hypothetical protein